MQIMPQCEILSTDLLRHLYRMMLRIRLCEEGLVQPILKGEIRTPCHLYSGQEAIAVGVCASLTKEDYVFGTHRSHGHFLAKGGDLRALVAEIYCRETGCCRGRGGSMHLVDPSIGMLGSAPIVAGTISLALGAALASSIREDGRIAVSFFGDGATGEGVLYEAMNFASLRKLPIVFACENNYYATHMPIRECRVAPDIYKTAEPFGIRANTVDGNDVLTVYEEAKKAADFCRGGQGPVFLEFRTYRFRGHVGPDDNVQGSHSDIRPREEVAHWLRRDPLILFEKRLLGEAGFVEEDLAAVRKQVADEIDAAFDFARDSKIPGREEVYERVFR